MKTRLLIGILILTATWLEAQQLAGWSNYRSFLYVYNPAAIQIFEDTESGNFIDLDAAYQNQWTRFEDAPTSIFLGGQYAVQDYNFTLGGKIINDQFGPSSFTHVELQYAYQLKFSGWDDHYLSIGVGASFTNFSIDGTELELQNPDDVLALQNNQSTTFINGIAGVYYQAPLYIGSSTKYLMIGLSADQAMPTPVEFTSRGSREVDFARVIHANGFLGFRSYHISGEDYTEAFLLSRYVENVPVFFMGGVRVSFLSQFLTVGAAISSNWILHPQVGFEVLENLTIGYSGAIFLSNSFSAQTGMSHEITLGFRGFL